MDTPVTPATIRCPNCGLNQFTSEKCRKCKTTFVFVSIPDPPKKTDKAPEPELSEETLGQRVRRLRRMKGLSMVKLARKMKCWRTYLTKIENDLTRRPELEQVVRIAEGLEVSFDELLTPETNPVLRDEFIQRLVPHLPRLSDEHREQILKYARELAANG